MSSAKEVLLAGNVAAGSADLSELDDMEFLYKIVKATKGITGDSSDKIEIVGAGQLAKNEVYYFNIASKALQDETNESAIALRNAYHGNNVKAIRALAKDLKEFHEKRVLEAHYVAAAGGDTSAIAKGTLSAKSIFKST
jgi:hypothetical protein